VIIKKQLINLFLPTTKSVIKAKKDIAVEFYADKCSGCFKEYGEGKWFAYHHMDYDPERKTSKEFRNTILYNRYVLGEVSTFPERFVLVCKSCHNRLDNYKTGMALVPKDTLTRLYMIAFLSKPKLRKTRTGGESIKSESTSH